MQETATVKVKLAVAVMFMVSSKFKGLGALVLTALMGVAKAEEEKASKVAVAISATLIGAISFQMMLFYLVNHSDKDIRQYSYQTISATISIFCAVLMFGLFNDIVEEFLLEGASLPFQLFIALCHMLVWFSIMTGALAWISGAVGGKPESMKKCEANMKCWAVLLAHMTGFAAINAWGTMQQLSIFTDWPPMTFVCTPIAIGGLYVLTKTTDTIRERVSKGDDGEEDEFEKLWDEETEEAENDVLGLALSFLLTQAIRYNISGIMPNQEGEEEGAIAGDHSTGQIGRLLGCAALFVILTALVLIKKPAGEMEGFQERLFSGTLVTVSMGFAWCIFFSTRWWLGSYPYLLADPMLLAVVVALFLSFASFSWILVLDKIADAEWTGEKADEIIIQIIAAIGILVGFAWEQCFDAAVDALASVSPAGALATKCVLTTFCVVIIVPAWRWWMLPMVIENGWQFGFVVTHAKLEMAFELLTEEYEEQMKKMNEAMEDEEEGYQPPEEK